MNPTSQQNAGNPLLDRFKCIMCQTWKPNALFSKKQLQNYKIGQNGVNARIRCLACVSQQNELKCLRCGNTYSLDHFSKAARKNGGSQWCKQCTSWKQAQEPGVTTAPAVSTDIAPDEQDLYDATFGSNGGYDDNGAMSDPEGGYSDDDYDNYGYQSTLGSQLENASSAGVSALPLGALSLVDASENETANTPYGLPLRSPAGGADNASTYTPSGLPLRTPAPGAVSTYTAYDAQGNAHARQYAPSETTSEASNTTIAPARATAWAKPAGRRSERPAMTAPVTVTTRAYDSEDEDEM